MSDKESKIKEIRTIEATREGLMGLSGKLGCIVLNLGQPIISHTNDGGGFMTEIIGFSSRAMPNYMDDWGDELPTMQAYNELGHPIEMPSSDGWQQKKNIVDPNIRTVGWHYYNLQNSNLEILYMIDEAEITVTYMGQKVFKEVAGDLQAYVPERGWEDKIAALAIQARKIEEKKIKEERDQRVEQSKKDKSKFIKKLKEKWGN